VAALRRFEIVLPVLLVMGGNFLVADLDITGKLVQIQLDIGQLHGLGDLEALFVLLVPGGDFLVGQLDLVLVAGHRQQEIAGLALLALQA